MPVEYLTPSYRDTLFKKLGTAESPTLQLAEIISYLSGYNSNALLGNAVSKVAAVPGLGGMGGTVTKSLLTTDVIWRAFQTSTRLARGRAFRTPTWGDARNVLTPMERGVMAWFRPVLTGSPRIMRDKYMPRFGSSVSAFVMTNTAMRRLFGEPETILGSIAQPLLSLGITNSLIKRGGILGILDTLTNSMTTPGSFGFMQNRNLINFNKRLRSVIELVNGKPVTSNINPYRSIIFSGWDRRTFSKSGILRSLWTMDSLNFKSPQFFNRGTNRSTGFMFKKVFNMGDISSRDAAMSMFAGLRGSPGLRYADYDTPVGIRSIADKVRLDFDDIYRRLIGMEEEAVLNVSRILDARTNKRLMVPDRYQSLINKFKIDNVPIMNLGDKLRRYYGSGSILGPKRISNELTDELRQIRSNTFLRTLSDELDIPLLGQGRSRLFYGTKNFEDFMLRRAMAGKAMRKAIAGGFMQTASKLMGLTWTFQLAGMVGRGISRAADWVSQTANTVKTNIREIRDIATKSVFGTGAVTTNQNILTDRQRSMAAINNSQLNVRSYIGEEASIMSSIY